jgi:succinylglutamate desuccinylase
MLLTDFWIWCSSRFSSPAFSLNIGRTLLKAKNIRDDVKKLTSKIEELIFEESEDKIRIFKRNAYKRVLPILREKAGDENLELHKFKKIKSFLTSN